MFYLISRLISESIIQFTHNIIIRFLFLIDSSLVLGLHAFLVYQLNRLAPIDIPSSEPTGQTMQSSASAVSYLLARHTKGICTQVTPGCPVNETIYGYRPSLVWNALFLAVFLLSALVHAGQGIYYRRWTFLIAMVVGGVCEAVGRSPFQNFDEAPSNLLSALSKNITTTPLTFTGHELI